MPDAPAKPATRKLKVVGMEIDTVRVEMVTWTKLKNGAKSPQHIAQFAGEVLDRWALKQKKGRGGPRPGSGRPRKEPKTEG